MGACCPSVENVTWLPQSSITSPHGPVVSNGDDAITIFNEPMIFAFSSAVKSSE
jgi:hypothetical protein